MWTNKPPLNLQKQVLKNQEDIEALQTNGSAPQLDAATNVSYDSTSGAIISYDNGTDLFLPLIPGDNIVIDATEDNTKFSIKAEGGGLTDYVIDSPASATNGTLPDDTNWEYLSTHPENTRILFNHEYYNIADNQHTTGTLVYSHVGYEASQMIVKTITITISARSWVLTTIKPASYSLYQVKDTTREISFIAPTVDDINTIGNAFHDIPATGWYTTGGSYYYIVTKLYFRTSTQKWEFYYLNGTSLARFEISDKPTITATYNLP